MADVTFGVKVPEELKENLQKLMSDSGLNGKDFMQQILNSYTLEKTKENIPAVAEDLKELQGLTQRINNIYLSLGYRIENITKAQLEQQQQELYKKDSLISDLQNKNNKSSNDYDALTDAFNNIVNQNNDYLQRVNELTESNINIKALNEQYKDKVDTMAGLLKQYEKYPAQLEEYKKLLGYSQTEVMELQNTLKDKARDVKTIEDKCNALLESQKTQQAEFKNTLAAEVEQHKAEIIQMREKEEFNKEKALLDKEKEYQATINKINAENNEKVKELLRENQEYNSKFSKLIEESQNKTGEINHLKDVIEKLMEEKSEKQIKS